MSIRAVAFDFGSVLARTDPAYLSAIEADHGLTRADWTPFFHGPRAVERHVGERFDRPAIERYLTRELTALCGNAAPEAARRLTGVFDNIASQIPNSDLIGLVSRLQAAGIPVGILSNGPIESLELFRTLMGPALPDVIVLSGIDNVHKPNRDAFQTVARALGVALQQCLLVDDLQEHVAAARALGMAGHCYRGDTLRLEADLRAQGLHW